jgi:hypothetical protein
MNLGNLLGAAGTAGSVYGAIDAADDVATMGNTIQSNLNTMGQTAADNSAFQGYGVTSTLGNSTIGADGSLNLGVGQNQGLNSGGMNMFNNAGNNFNAAGGLAQAGAGPNAMQNQGAGMVGGAGNSMYGQAGSAFNAAQQGLGAAQNGMLGASQQAMNNAMQPTAGREQDIYNRTMAMQNPQLDAAQAQQQAREYAMGRGGVMGSQFGGTAEDAAMAKARAQASNQAAFGAMNQAQTEMMNQGTLSNQFGQLGQNAAQLQGQLGQQMGNLGSQNYQNQITQGSQLAGIGGDIAGQQLQGGQIMGQLGAQQGSLGLDGYGSSFLPMEHQMALLQQGNHGADAAQTGQLTGQGYLTQLGLGGAQTNVNAQNVAAQLKGNLYDSILDNIGGSSTSEGGMSGLVGMLEGIFKP